MALSKADIDYDQDYNLWIEQTVELLKAHRFDEIDLENLIAELESMSKRDKRELLSRFKVLLMHLLKWQYQPDKRSNSWRSSIRNNRAEITQIIEDSPSLKVFPSAILDKAYRFARADAADETGLDLADFPIECLFTADQALDTEFWPESKL
ncbi:MAG: DUF29 domain-containing protein [Aphanocapsa sp. GSE-SYN-MK-11-07L]|jgi:hypothetical protein|nr:DUF29 domain-containing protein [Aphanocapsa sp. GSE-SYN-MK-11-07L]